MKFEKFAKMAIPYCSTVSIHMDPDNWLKVGKMYARIPAYIGQIGSMDKNDKKLEAVFESMDITELAELTRASLPADGKAKDIVREFSNGYEDFCLSNEQFGLIERYDHCYITEVDEEEYRGKAFLVGKPASNPDDFKPDLIITDIEEKEEEDE